MLWILPAVLAPMVRSFLSRLLGRLQIGAVLLVGLGRLPFVFRDQDQKKYKPVPAWTASAGIRRAKNGVG